MSKIIHLDIEIYKDRVFPIVDMLQYADAELYPDYEQFPDAMHRLWSILDATKLPYYRWFYQKEAYLFLSISTWHLFMNGNKRLALASFFVFHVMNGYDRKSTITVKSGRRFFKKYFPAYQLEMIEFNSVEWRIMYNFNKCINIKKSEKPYGHEYDFDELKEITTRLFKRILCKKKNQ